MSDRGLGVAATLWVMAAGAILVATDGDAGLASWLTERRAAMLVPLLACCCGAAWSAERRSRGLALSFSGFALVWAGWGVVARLQHDVGDAVACLHATLHERVVLPAIGLAAVAWLRSENRSS